MATVITYQSPGDPRRVHLTEDQEQRLREAGIWPRDHRGEECCRVYHGAHEGTPTPDDEIGLAHPR